LIFKGAVFINAVSNSIVKIINVKEGGKAMKSGAQNSFLKGVLLFVLILSFTGLIVGGFWVFKSMAPRPLEVVDGKGAVVTTQAQI
jgi:hypothetical protein